MVIHNVLRLHARAMGAVRCTNAHKLRQNIVCIQTCGYLTVHKPFTQQRSLLQKWIPITQTGASVHRARPSEPNWNLQEVIINTNIGRFHEKPDGVFFRIHYIDTGFNFPPSVQEKMPTVLALPTSPGTYKDLIPIVAPLAYRGVRVVVPNFPGFEFTQKLINTPKGFQETWMDACYYTQSTTERTEFLLRFLAHLEITDLDLVVGYGYGSVPLLVMLNTEFESHMKSALFLCPTPVHIPSSFARPRWWVNVILDIIDGRNIQTIFGYILPNVHARMHGLKARDTTERYDYLQLTARVGFYGIPDFATGMAKKKKPFSFLFTQNEKYFKTKDYVTYANLLGIKNEDIYQTDANAEWKDTFDSNYKRAALFPTTVDNPQKFNVFRDFIVKEIFHLLKLGNTRTDDVPQNIEVGGEKATSN